MPKSFLAIILHILFSEKWMTENQHMFLTKSAWIYAFPSDWNNEDGKLCFGKWLVFRKHEELDETWQLIKTHVRSGYLGKQCADCSTMVRTETSGTKGVICVFTSKEDIDEIGLKLIKLVLDKKLLYKTNAATMRNLYAVYGVRKLHTKHFFGMMVIQKLTLIHCIGSGLFAVKGKKTLT